MSYISKFHVQAIFCNIVIVNIVRASTPTTSVVFYGYPALIKCGKHPIEMEVLIGTSTIRGGFSIGTFDCQKVL